MQNRTVQGGDSLSLAGAAMARVDPTPRLLDDGGGAGRVFQQASQRRNPHVHRCRRDEGNCLLVGHEVDRWGIDGRDGNAACHCLEHDCAERAERFR